jgi:hypothetical protein
MSVKERKEAYEEIAEQNLENLILYSRLALKCFLKDHG